MKSHLILLSAVFWMLVIFTAPASVLYVNLNSMNPTTPYTNWNTASKDIQSAVDTASDGDIILVTNGLYQSGGRPVFPDFLTNRVAVDKAVTVQSVNGPAMTLIQGFQVALSATNAYLAVRCVYLANNALLVGFTLTNGGTWWGSPDYNDKTGGGIWCETNAVVTNCVISDGYAFTSGGGAYQGNYYNCAFIGNTAVYYGGGVANSILVNCTLTNNLQWYPNFGSGGGAYSCTLNNCTLTGNQAAANDDGSGNGGGGGAYSSVLNNCELIQNSGYSGGGVYLSNLTNCMVISNSAAQWGGAAYNCAMENCTVIGNSVGGSFYGGGGAAYGTLNCCSLIGNTSPLGFGGGAVGAVLANCKLYGNSASVGGGAANGILENCIVISNSAFYTSNLGFAGGVYGSWLTNCTVAGNSAFADGGTYESSLNNCIVYFNTASTNSNYDQSDAYNSFNFSCTAPFPTNGTGNIANNPLFVNQAGGDYHLESNSPCINAGNNVYVTNSTDLGGNPRIVGGTVDIGSYEYQTPTSIISYAWLQQYCLPTDGSADYADSDGTGMNNWQKWIAGLNPTNAASVLQISSLSNSLSGITVKWQSVNTRMYYLQSSTNLPAFTAIQSNLVGQVGSTSYMDTTATNGGPYFYRVGVQ